jgi:hypothetical protein
MLLAARLRRWALAVAVCGGVLLPGAAVPGVACAGEGGRAALVVDTGDSITRLCVELGDESITGLELIVLAGEQHGLDYHLGFGGQAVCMLAGVGPTGDDCFEQYPNFWGYWRGDGGGEWTWSGTGATATMVEDGDVEGWSWGAGDGPDTHPQPPDTLFSDVCEMQEPPEDTGSEPPATPEPTEPGPTPTRDAVGGGSESEAPPQRTSRPSPPAQRRDRRWHAGTLGAELPAVTVASPAPSPAPSPTGSRGARELVAEPSSDGGPPPAGIAAIAGAVVLVLAGGAVARRRS